MFRASIRSCAERLRPQASFLLLFLTLSRIFSRLYSALSVEAMLRSTAVPQMQPFSQFSASIIKNGVSPSAISLAFLSR